MYAIISSIVAFGIVFVATPPLIKYLTKQNMTVPDVHKQGKVMVPRPGGISLVAGAVSSEIVLYAFLQLDAILGIIFTTIAAFVVGYIDDKRPMTGWFKPIGLAVAALPILLVGAYDTNLAFPIFGEVQIPILYVGVIIMMIVILGNTINSIDVANGIASMVMIISGSAVTISLIIIQNYEIAVAAIPLVMISVAFYRYHKIPSRIFPGDSGALLFGAMYGAIAIYGGVEVVAAVALLPAVFNSFLFLSSVKRIVEYKKAGGVGVTFGKDSLLRATDDPTAPVSLVRLILTGGPLTESQIGRAIYKLCIFSGGLAIVTALMML